MDDQIIRQAKLAKRIFTTLEERYPDDQDLKKLHAVAAGGLQILGIDLTAIGEEANRSGGVDKNVILADENGEEPASEGEEA